MQIKVDEDLPTQAATFLTARGHATTTVRQQNMGGWNDADLWLAV